METKIQELIEKHRKGTLSVEEQQQLETLIEQGVVALESLEGFYSMDERLMKLESPAPSSRVDAAFYSLLASEKSRSNRFSFKRFFAPPELMPKLAFATVTLLAGLTVGFFLRPASSPDQIHVLTQQVSDLKEMMMLSLLEKESVTDRLKAVSLTEDMNQASQKVTSALIQTLNNDEDINVRLAALDALRPYTQNDSVRIALVQSIRNQDSPLVQVALAELMAALQVKSSVSEFERVLQDRKTPSEVKEKIKETLQVLI